MADEPKTNVEEMTGHELDELAEKLGVEDWKKGDKVGEKREKLAPLVKASRNAEAKGDGAADAGEKGTAPTSPNGADDGDEHLEEPSESEDGAPTHPAVQQATQGLADPAGADPTANTGDLIGHPLGTRASHEEALAATEHSQDAAQHGDTPQHPLPVRDSAEEATLTNFEQDPDAVQPKESAGYPPVGKPDYTRGFEKGDLTAEQKKSLAAR